MADHGADHRTDHEPSGGWLLPGIDPKGDLVRRIEEIAARENVGAAQWVERWLTVVLHQHYSPTDTKPETVRAEARATQQAVRHNLDILGDQLGRLYRNVETAHRRTEAVEDEVRESGQDPKRT